MLKFSMNTSKATTDLQLLGDEALPNAVRLTLNAIAKSAAAYARSKTLPKYFELRNNWTRGSIIPNKNNIGLVPESQKNIEKMFSVFGSKQEYLAKQEFGFTEKRVSIPLTTQARQGGAFSGIVKPSARIARITKQIRSYRDVRSKAKTIKGKTFAMLAISEREHYRGAFALNVEGVFPKGIYIWSKGRANRKFSFRRVTRIRENEKNKKYTKKPWFSDTLKIYWKQSTYDYYWNKIANQEINKILKG